MEPTMSIDDLQRWLSHRDCILTVHRTGREWEAIATTAYPESVQTYRGNGQTLLQALQALAEVLA